MREAGLLRLQMSGHAETPHPYVLRPVRHAGGRGMAFAELKAAMMTSTRPFLHRAIKPFNLVDYVGAFPRHFSVRFPIESADGDLARWHVTAVGPYDAAGSTSEAAPLPPLDLPQSMRPR